MHSNLTAILRQNGLLTLAQEQQVLEQAGSHNQPAILALVELGLFDHSALADKLSQLFGLPLIDVNQYDYAPLCQSLGQRELIASHTALPLKLDNHTLTIAVADPSNSQIEDDFRFATNYQIELVLGEFREISAAIRRMYGKSVRSDAPTGKEISQDELASLVQVSADEVEETEDLSQDEAPVSRFINQVLLDAVRKGASDIHFEPYEDNYRIRLRCDGILVETQKPAAQLSRRLAARLKILSRLDIAERRLPQDGRIKLRLNADTAIDLRVSTLPTLWGEKIVLRLLDSSAANLDIDRLGYSEQQKALYLGALKQPQGMILMTGPTGSGKTVSLYTGLRILNTPERNISTAEDPVEINLTGVNQVQVNPKIGFGFAEALRSFLRQDPDIVMVGEIRDLETAEIAVKAAQTGHLVLSTLHTNSAAETVVRLTNMGIETFNLASSLSLIIAQRLGRRLCPHCKEQDPMSAIQRKELGLSREQVVYRACKGGCTECTGGYSGRVGIYEVMKFDARMANAVAKGATIAQLEAVARHCGMLTLRESGIEKLKQGITSYAELQRVLYL